jgi:hypothetical protein
MRRDDAQLESLGMTERNTSEVRLLGKSHKEKERRKTGRESRFPDARMWPVSGKQESGGIGRGPWFTAGAH